MRLSLFLFPTLCLWLFLAATTVAAAPTDDGVAIKVDLTTVGEALNRGYALSAGSCHATTGLRADWHRHLTAAHTDLGFEYVRFHGIFDDDMSVVVVSDDQFWFFNTDNVYDFLVSIGMRPIVELSFMPVMLASGNETIFHYQGNTTPPKDYDQWASLITAFVGHLVDRYGLPEVAQWYFEVWNEPNLAFWSGTQEEYFTLYTYTARAIKAVSPLLRVGGPATAQTQWIPDFLDYTTQNAVPVDFVSTHLYPTDPNVPQNYSTAFADVIYDAAMQSGDGQLPLLLTEYNAGLGIDILDTSYAAAFVVKQIPYLMRSENLVLWSYWTFTDIFEENGQNPYPFSNAFGMQTIQQVPKPVYRGFQLLKQYAGDTILLDGVTQDPSPTDTTVDCWVTRQAVGANFSYASFLTNFNVYGLSIAQEDVTIQYMVPDGTAIPQYVTLFVLDDQHSNPRALWESWGMPTYPSQVQISELLAASELSPQLMSTTIVGANTFSLSLTLSSQSLAVIVF